MHIDTHVGYAHAHQRTTHIDVTQPSAVLFCGSLQRLGGACTCQLCGPDKTVSLIIHCQKMVLIMGCSPPTHTHSGLHSCLFSPSTSLSDFNSFNNGIGTMSGNVRGTHSVSPVIDPRGLTLQPTALKNKLLCILADNESTDLGLQH